MKKYRFLLFLICGFSGCVNPFAPSLAPSDTDTHSILGDQTTVDGIFQLFQQAYNFQDTVLYGKLLAPNFIFTYQDYDKGIDIFWGRDEEMRTTNGLFQSTQHLDLIWNNIIAKFGDSLETTVIRNFNLTVTFTANDIVRINGYANLSLQRSQTDAVWKIARWKDESNF